MKTLNNISTIMLVLLVSMYVGDIIGSLVTEKEANIGNIATVTIEKPKEPPKKIYDILTLENRRQIITEIIDGRRVVHIFYEDLEELSKKKSKLKKIVSRINALFLRLEDR